MDRVTSDSLADVEFAGLESFLVQGNDGSDVVTFKTRFLTGAANYAYAGTPTDTLVIEGSDGEVSDSYFLTKPLDAMVMVADRKSNGVAVTAQTMVHLRMDTLGGDDQVVVDVEGTELIPLLITYNGGSNSDTLTLQGTPVDGAAEATYSPGPSVDEGRLEYTSELANMTIDFVGLEPVLDLIPGTLTVNGTDADNAINYSQSLLGGAFGRVAVDAFERINFSLKTLLTINGLAGSDVINLDNAATPTLLAGIVVNGGADTDGDRVIANATTAQEAIFFTPTADDAATITGVTGVATVSVNTTESLLINGKGGSDTLNVVPTGGSDVIEVTPGASFDSGTVLVNSLLSMDFTNLGLGLLNIADNGGEDVLVYNGTEASDVFTVPGSLIVSPSIKLNAQVVVGTVEIENYVLRGLGGDDSFNILSQEDIDILVEGDEPGSSDTLNYARDLLGANQVVVELDSDFDVPFIQTITQAGYGTVTHTGIETVNADIEDGDLTVVGTRGDDVITFTPLSEDSGQLTAENIATTYNIDDVPQGNDLVITGGVTGRGGPTGGGYADKVIYNGTNGVDVILVDTPNRTVGLGTTIPWRSIELDAVDVVEVLEVAGNDGNDTVWVVPGAAVGNGLFVSVDGGSPQASDALVITNVGDGAVPLGPNDFVVVGQSRNPDAGNILVYRDAVRLPAIAYENVEVVSPNVFSGNNLLILGPDQYEQNEYYQTAAYLGSGETLNVENLAIFPNIDEHPGVPADQDYFRVVAETTGILDFQIYFHVYDVDLLPAGGNINIEVLDGSGDLVAGNGAFGSYDVTANARIRIPAVAGQTYYLRVFGAADQVVNGYDMTIVNTAPPVPYDIELLDLPVDPNYDCTQDPPANNSDTGRSHFDNVTCDARPTVIIRLDDDVLLNDIPGSSGIDAGVDGVIPIPFNPSTDPVADDTVAGYRVAVYIEGEPQQPGVLPEQVIGYAEFVDNGVYQFDFANAFWPDLAPEDPITQLTDGSHYISARVEIIAPSIPAEHGYGDRSESLEIFVDTDHPNVTEFDLADEDMCEWAPDNVTNDTTPSFYGYVDEANTVLRIYVDLNGNNDLDIGIDRLLGEAVAIPIDGNNQFDEAFFEFTTPIDLNDPSLGLPKDGLRVLFATAEDLAGNVTPEPEAAELRIFIDTQGPQITDVYLTADPDYDLFDPKPSEDGPTPLVNAITIEFRDLPQRVAEFNYPALVREIAEHTGHYHLVGVANGIIPINVDENGDGIIVQFFTQGGIAMARVTLPFANPLPDDRYTLVVADNLIDPACNNLDGESNAEEPQEVPLFPTGDTVPGGDFTARFTVDSRPEIGVWAAGNIWVDTNGNNYFDPENTDYTNRDIIYQMGYTSDDIFAGNFALGANEVADGFDKLAAYGKVNNVWRWLVDTTNNGVPNVEQKDPLNINGLPVAGNFDKVNNVDGELVALNGDEVGVFTGNTWYFDTNHDYKLDASSKLTTDMVGYPIVGDFDGDGFDDLGTWTDDYFSLDLANGSLRGWDGSADVMFRVGFIGVRERPVAADMDQDGFDDLGLWLPDRSGAVPREDGEWSFLVSDGASLLDRLRVDPIAGDWVIDYTPIPFGPDMYAKFGDDYALPVVGNFDPPVAGSGSAVIEPGGNLHTNLDNPLDVNADGTVAPIDALLVINYLNFHGAGQLEGAADGAPYLDVNMDGMAAAIDSLMVINYLNTHGTEGEGEGGASVAAASVSPALDLQAATTPATVDTSLNSDLLSMAGLVESTSPATSSLLEPTVLTVAVPAQESIVENYALLIGYLPFDAADLFGDDAQAGAAALARQLEDAGLLDDVLEQLAADVSDRQRVEILDEIFGDWTDA